MADDAGDATVDLIGTEQSPGDAAAQPAAKPEKDGETKEGEEEGEKVDPLASDGMKALMNFEKMILHLIALKEAKIKETAELEEQVRKIDQDIGITAPKLEALNLMIDLKKRKEIGLNKNLKEKTADFLSVKNETRVLLKRAQLEAKAHGRKFASETTVETKGFTTNVSVKDIRAQKAPSYNRATGNYTVQAVQIEQRNREFGYIAQ